MEWGLLIFPLIIMAFYTEEIVTKLLKHREKIAEIKSGAQPINEDGRYQELLARYEALEKRCAKLEEQVLHAHELIADEQRELDRKLAQKFPDISAIPSSHSEKSAPAARKESVNG